MNKNVLAAIIAVLFAALIGYALGRGTDLDLEVELPDGTKVNMEVAGRSIDHADLLSQMFTDGFLAGAVRQWLADHQDIMSLRDERLAQKLESVACDSIPAGPLVAHLQALRVCADKPANSALRKLAFEDHGYPFQRIGVATPVSVPESQDWPGQAEASVCSRDFWGRRLELVSAASNEPVFVQATQLITDCSLVGVGTAMHLHPATARKIFGRRLLGIDTVFVVIAGSD